MTTTSAQQEIMVSAIDAAPEPVVAAPERSAADRFMRRLLRVGEIDRSAQVQRAAHRGFRLSMVLSGVRCLITYLLIPIFVPIIGLSGMVAAPIGIVLSLIAVVSGIFSVRRFWVSDHRMKWMYTGFIAFVFVVLAIALVSDISRIVSGA